MSEKEPDFAKVRDLARFEEILGRYGLEARGRGAERMIRCPFHADKSPSCSVNLDKKVFHCFACGAAGSILDFVARMESCSLGGAARLIDEWEAGTDPGMKPSAAQKAKPRSSLGNQPLDFTLPLDPGHPYLGNRNLSEATVIRYGLGYCTTGIMKGRICIPIHDEHGRLVAYAGRWPGNSLPEDQPRYLLPRGFRKGQLLFNVHRVREAKHLVIVEGFWSVFRLDALGIPAVALMGCTLSPEQENLLRRTMADRLTLLLDGDDAGRDATRKIVPRLARHSFVRAPAVPDGAEPDTMDEAELFALLQV
ncbi:MAG: CHC2 zinc finger domain-containing protein [Alphaproteobacteria bacterium]|nr:CHC2 zinc finger domain-containing protein [Alphaproteobacteria bacterium]